MPLLPVQSPIADLLASASDEFEPTDEMRRAVVAYADWLQDAEARGRGRISFPDLAVRAGLPEDAFEAWITGGGFRFATWFNTQVLCRLAIYFPMVRMEDIQVALGHGSAESTKQVANSARERLTKVYDPNFKDRAEVETSDRTWSDAIKALREKAR